jgi:hypothetical protein
MLAGPVSLKFGVAFAYRRASSIGKGFLSDQRVLSIQDSLQLCSAGTPFLSIANALQGPIRLISDIALGGSTVYFSFNLP